MTIYIAFANQKGGVGKTFLTVHAAAWLARTGHRVGVIDADPQANATSYLTSEAAERNGLVQLLVARMPPLKAAVPINGEWKLALVPGSWETGKALAYMCDGQTPFGAIRDRLRAFDGIVEYILIDMPPSRNTGFLETLHACDQLVIPTNLGRFGVEGILSMAQALDHIRQAHGHAPDLLGVVPNLYRDTNIEKQRLDQLVTSFGGAVWPAVPLRVAAAEAESAGRSLFSHNPGADITQAVQGICERLTENSK